MARRIRRRPGVIWLPLSTENRLTLDNPVNGGSTCLGQYAIVSNVGGSPGDTISATFPVVADQPQPVASLTSSLADQQGSAYRLRRIVGKIYVEYDQQVVAPEAEVVLVTVGFIIVEVENSLNFLPKSATDDDYSLVHMDNVSDPWIWRRSWVVGKVLQTTLGSPRVGTGQFSFIPSNNFSAGYGSGVMDGPHIDAKTARLVKNEQRLCMVISVTGIAAPVGGGGGGAAVTIVTTDLRVLASLRRQSGNRHNAAR